MVTMTEETKEYIFLRKTQVKRWANTLYAIAQEGLHNSNNKYDSERYDKIKAISNSIYKNWNRDKEEKEGSISVAQLDYFINRLFEIVESGIEKTASEFDVELFIDTRMIFMDMENVRENYNVSKQKNLSKTDEKAQPKGKFSKELLTRFFKDEQLPNALMDLICGAKEKLWISSPWINDILNLEQQLVALKEKHVEILILTRNKYAPYINWVSKLS